jgi:hypothetical protein
MSFSWGIPLLSLLFVAPQICFINFQRQKKDWVFYLCPCCHLTMWTVLSSRWNTLGVGTYFHSCLFLFSERACASYQSVSSYSLSSSIKWLPFILYPKTSIVVFCNGLPLVGSWSKSLLFSTLKFSPFPNFYLKKIITSAYPLLLPSSTLSTIYSFITQVKHFLHLVQTKHSKAVSRRNWSSDM